MGQHFRIFLQQYFPVAKIIFSRVFDSVDLGGIEKRISPECDSNSRHGKITIMIKIPEPVRPSAFPR